MTGTLAFVGAVLLAATQAEGTTTPSETDTGTQTPSPTATLTRTSSRTGSVTRTASSTRTSTATRTFTITSTPSITTTRTASVTPTATISRTPTESLTPSSTATITPTPPSWPPFLWTERNVHDPAGGNLRVAFVLFDDASPTLDVYDSAGEHVRRLFEGRVIGLTLIETAWDGTNTVGGRCASGVYLLRLAAKRRVEWRRVALLRR